MKEGGFFMPKFFPANSFVQFIFRNFTKQVRAYGK